MIASNEKSMVRHLEEDSDGACRRHRRHGVLPRSLDEVRPVCAQVARDIRNQYKLGYYPCNTAKDGTFRTVQVEVVAAERPRKTSG